MSWTTISYRVHFPDRQAIINYIVAHPAHKCLEMDAVSSRVPHSIEKVAHYFADKEMPDREIGSHVRNLLADFADHKKLADFGSALQQLAGSIEESKKGEASSFADRLRLLSSQAVQPDPFFETIVQMYSLVLNHLIDGKGLDPALECNSKWMRETVVHQKKE